LPRFDKDDENDLLISVPSDVPSQLDCEAAPDNGPKDTGPAPLQAEQAGDALLSGLALAAG
jgi:hypothetical protein